MVHQAGCWQPPGVARRAQGTLTVSGLAAGDIGDGEHMAQRQNWPFACCFPILNLSFLSPPLHISILAPPLASPPLLSRLDPRQGRRGSFFGGSGPLIRAQRCCPALESGLPLAGCSWGVAG